MCTNQRLAIIIMSRAQRIFRRATGFIFVRRLRLRRNFARRDIYFVMLLMTKLLNILIIRCLGVRPWQNSRIIVNCRDL